MFDFSALQAWSQRFRSGVILAFHDLDAESFRSLVLSTGRFDVVPLDEIVTRSQSGKSTSGLLAITVDDGVGSTVRDLSKVCSEQQWPVTFYLPVDWLDSREDISFQRWRRLKPVLLGNSSNLRLTAMNLQEPDAVGRFERRLQRLWHTTRAEEYGPLLEQLWDEVVTQTGLDAIPESPHPISWPEVTAISRNPLVSFESHGLFHVALSALTPEEIDTGMKSSQTAIIGHTGRPCRHFAYPFGSPESIGTAAMRIAASYYRSATTMILGGVNGANPWFLPRVPLYSENAAAIAALKVHICEVLPHCHKAFARVA